MCRNIWDIWGNSFERIYEYLVILLGLVGGLYLGDILVWFEGLWRFGEFMGDGIVFELVLFKRIGD